jgi:hypothetical protein
MSCTAGYVVELASPRGQAIPLVWCRTVDTRCWHLQYPAVMSIIERHQLHYVGAKLIYWRRTHTPLRLRCSTAALMYAGSWLMVSTLTAVRNSQVSIRMKRAVECILATLHALLRPCYQLQKYYASEGCRADCSHLHAHLLSLLCCTSCRVIAGEAISALQSSTSIVFARHTMYDAIYVAGGAEFDCHPPCYLHSKPVHYAQGTRARRLALQSTRCSHM